MKLDIEYELIYFWFVNFVKINMIICNEVNFFGMILVILIIVIYIFDKSNLGV